MQYVLAASQLADFKDISNEMEAWGCGRLHPYSTKAIIINYHQMIK